MKQIRKRLTFANVMSAIAVFIALGGAAVAATQLPKNSVGTKQLKSNAVTTVKIKKNAVTTAKIKNGAVTGAKVAAGSLNRSQLASGTLAGTQVTELTSAPVPGLGEVPNEDEGTPVPLTGNATFTPAAGKSYEVLAELRGNPVDADGAGSEECWAEVYVLANGHYFGSYSYVVAAENRSPIFKLQPVGTSAAALGLQEAGKPITLSAVSVTSGGCKSLTASFKATVIELG